MSYDLHKKYGDMRLLDTPICGMHSSPSLHHGLMVQVTSADSKPRPRASNMKVSGLASHCGTSRPPALAENGFMGMGIGAAMTGLRVIIEGMNMGFLLLAYNQISNNAGMLHYTSGGQYKVALPMLLPLLCTDS